MKSSTSKSNVFAQILLAAVAGALGYLLLFGKDVQVLTLCQILCGGLVAVGVVSIVSFFLTGDFKRIDRYGFAYGVLLVILGFIGLLRMNELTANFEIYAGILSLILGVLVLQGTVQIKALGYPVWVLILVLSLASIGGAFCVLSNITFVTQLISNFSSWVLLVNGAACLFSMIITGICILLAGRREKKARKEAENQQSAPAPASYEQIPQGEYRPADEAAHAPVFEPAESHHSGFADEAAPAPSDLPPVESPELTFEPSETHHSDFKPTE